MIRKIISLISIFAVLFSLCAFAGYREIDSLFFVSAIGFDYKDGYKISLETVSAGGNEIETEPFSKTYYAKGDTLKDAMQKIYKKLPKGISFDHTVCAVMGKGIKKRQLKRVISFLLCNKEINISLSLFCSDISANTLLLNAKPVSLCVGYDILGLKNENEKRNGASFNNTLFEISDKIKEEKSVSLPKLKLKEDTVVLEGKANDKA